MAWLVLFLAGLFEIAWAIGLKYTQGFTRLWPSLWVAAAMGASIWLLAQATRHLPIGTAYAVWTGIGAAGTALVGMLLFNESRDWLRLASIALVALGILGLRFAHARAGGA